MKNSGRNISLTSYDDLFSTEETRRGESHEQIQRIPLSELHPFKDHPFRVVDDDRMMETVESVKEYGVLVPAIARPLEDGGYEIIAGHRRKRACELAGMDEMPVIVRNLDDDFFHLFGCVGLGKILFQRIVAQRYGVVQGLLFL